jgi:glycogen synthase kinase 3 beta
MGKIVPPHYESSLLSNGVDIHNFVPMTTEEMRNEDVPH